MENENMYNVEGLLNARLEHLKQSLSNFEESFQIQMQDYTEKYNAYQADPTPSNQELANASYDKLMKIEFDMQNIQERVTNITTTLTGITEENTDTLDTEDSHTL